MQDYGLRAMVLPSFALGITMSALIMRITRSSLLEELRVDYVQTARPRVARKGGHLEARHEERDFSGDHHRWFSAGISPGRGGFDRVRFNLPGIGRLFVDAIHGRDYPIVQACLLIFVVIFVVTNLIVDICYAIVDPGSPWNRIRSHRKVLSAEC